MIYLGLYNEINPGKGYPSMREFFSAEPYVGQREVVYYLLHGNEDMVSAKIPVDVFTGKPIRMNQVGMNDGEYSWWNTLAYYVEKYNLRLPQSFVEKAIKTAKAKHKA